MKNIDLIYSESELPRALLCHETALSDIFRIKYACQSKEVLIYALNVGFNVINLREHLTPVQVQPSPIFTATLSLLISLDYPT